MSADHVTKSLSFPAEQLKEFQLLADRLSGSAAGKGNLSLLLRFAVETTYRGDLAQIRLEQQQVDAKLTPKRTAISL